MRKLAILGASGHGKVVAEIAELTGWREIVFYDDNWPQVTSLEKWQVVGNTEQLLADFNEHGSVSVAIGNNAIRYEKCLFLLEKGFDLISLIHPGAIVSGYSELGRGAVIMAGSIVNPFVKLGTATIINTAATIDHDCLIEDGVHISPGAHLAGAVKVGALSWIGIGASLKQGVSIGREAMVGAGAVVLQDVPDGATVVGVPAKEIDKKIPC